jgi:hypothetical protein
VANGGEQPAWPISTGMVVHALCFMHCVSCRDAPLARPSFVPTCC